MKLSWPIRVCNTGIHMYVLSPMLHDGFGLNFVLGAQTKMYRTINVDACRSDIPFLLRMMSKLILY
jgi:hypothetical protein